MGDPRARQVQEHGLVVDAPVVLQEALFGGPAEADGRCLRLRPPPVDPPIDVVHEGPDLDFLRVRPVEVGLTEQGAGEQDSGIDGGQLAVPEALARFHVQEVVKESAVTGRPPGVSALRSFGKKPQGREHALPCLITRDVAALDADRVCRETEAHGGDARVRRGRIPVRDQSILGIGSIPEEAERTLLELQEERVEDGNRLAFSRDLQLHFLRFRGRAGAEDHDHRRDGRDQEATDAGALSRHNHLLNPKPGAQI